MKIQKSWFLAAGAIVGLIGAGIPRANAGSSHRQSHALSKHSPSLAASPRSSRDGRFFLGHGGAVHGPFHLNGGKYIMNVLANYNSAYDSGSGQCIFTAYLNGVEQPAFLSLGTGVPVLPSAPYVAAIPFTASAGHYKLIVSPNNTCDYSVTILSRGAAAPGIEVLGARSYLYAAKTFTPKSVVHMGEILDFEVFYRLVGGLKGKPTGTMTIREHTGAPQTAHLLAAKDFNGIKEMYVYFQFTQKTGDTPGPAVAKFTITDGGHHITKTLKFTVAP